MGAKVGLCRRHHRQGGGQGGVHLGGEHAQLARFGGEVVGRRTAAEVLRGPVGGELPAFHTAGEVRLQDRQGGTKPLDPAERRRAGLEAGADQGPGHLQLGVDARLQPAEQLEDQAVAEHQRGVGLLGAEQPAGPRSVSFHSGSLLKRSSSTVSALAIRSRKTAPSRSSATMS